MNYRIPLALVLALPLPSVQGAPSSAADGVLDLTFAVGGDRVVEFDRGVNDTDLGRTVLVDAEDRIYLIGDVNTAGGNRIGIVRLLPDGDIDTSYGTGGDGRLVAPAAGQSIRVGGAAFAADGHLIVVGSRVASGADTNFVACRASPAGSLVTFPGTGSACMAVPFDLGGDLADHAEAVVVQPDGRIVLAGTAATADGAKLALARLLPDGNLDPSFGTAGKTTYITDGYVRFEAASVQLGANGSLLVAGTAVTGNASQFGFMARFGTDGAPDDTFGNSGGITRSPSGNTVYTDAIQDPRGHIVAIGTTMTHTTSPRGFAACYTNGGGLFNCPGGNSTLEVSIGHAVSFADLQRQPDGRWLVAGAWKPMENGPWRTLLLRIRRDLVADEGDFAAPTGYIGHSYGHDYDFANGVALQHSRIIVAGSSKRANGLNYDYAVSGYRLDRIFADGLER